MFACSIVLFSLFRRVVILRSCSCFRHIHHLCVHRCADKAVKRWNTDDIRLVRKAKKRRNFNLRGLSQCAINRNSQQVVCSGVCQRNRVLFLLSKAIRSLFRVGNHLTRTVLFCFYWVGNLWHVRIRDDNQRYFLVGCGASECRYLFRFPWRARRGWVTLGCFRVVGTD